MSIDFNFLHQFQKQIYCLFSQLTLQYTNLSLLNMRYEHYHQALKTCKTSKYRTSNILRDEI